MKKYNEHLQTKPLQLTFFELIGETDNKYSRSIELYDFMPKYVWGKYERNEDGSLPILFREFVCRDIERQLVVHPAAVTNEKDHSVKYCYMGVREEIVEEALRKLAVSGQGVFLDDQAGIAFSVYDLKKELSERGHTYSHEEVVEALNVLALTRLELKNPANKKDKIVFSPIENLGLRGIDGETQSFVRFSPFVTESIKNQTFRLFNYEQTMKYRSVIARQLHKRMAHHFTGVTFGQVYKILLSTIIRDFGLKMQNRIKSNLENVENALKEMEKEKVIVKYTFDKIYDLKKRNKVVDAMVNIIPSMTFINDVVAGNADAKSMKAKNQQRELD